MKVKAKTAFFHGKQLCKKGDVIEIEAPEFNGINMIEIPEGNKPVEVVETKPARANTRKTTTKKTSNKKSK